MIAFGIKFKTKNTKLKKKRPVTKLTDEKHIENSGKIVFFALLAQ